MLLSDALLCVAGYQEPIDTFLCGQASVTLGDFAE